MIGDGMGPQQLGLLFAYKHYASGLSDLERISAIEQMARRGQLALVRTEPHGVLVTDSAAAATQLATGKWAGSEMIGVDYQGNAAETVLEIAKRQGKSTGLVSDTRLTHATPAAFASHQRHRSMENEIAVDLLENKVDVMLSGGLRHWIPRRANEHGSATYLGIVQMNGGLYEPSSKRDDNRNLLLEARGDYQLVFDHTALEHVSQGRVLGLFANSEMLDAIGERNALARQDLTEPTLVEMSEKAIELLSQNPQGFFLMIEGGQIDWAGHNNDTGDLLEELLQFDAAVDAVVEWAQRRDDTLVLVTADHETGGFGFSYSAADLPAPRALAGDVFRGAEHEPNFNFEAPAKLDAIAAQRKSFFQIFTEFDALAPKEQRAEVLQERVNEAIAPLQISLGEAQQLLNRRPNRYYREGHPYLGTKTMPAMPDQEAFFVYGENLRFNRLGHLLAAQHGATWSTGTHTNTPVALVSIGPGAGRFRGLLHATEVGQRMMALVRGE